VFKFLVVILLVVIAWALVVIAWALTG